MEGQAILDHFSARLHSIEAAMPSLRSVRRLAEAPHSMQELDHFRSSYEGEPVVFPASSWAPCWKQRLGASSVAEGLKNLLTNVVQVETFRLTYTASQIGSQFKDMVCLADENSTKRLNSERAARKRGPWAGDLPSLTVHNESCTAAHNATESNTTALSECQTVCLPEISSSSVGENYCWDSQLINDAPYLHPIPISTKEHMDFGLFVAEALELISAPKNQLLYLTWRGLPDARQTNPPDETPEEFVFFLENLLFPTINPPFIPVEFVKQRNIWMGSIVTSQIHFDALDNLHICISNRKVFHLYSPLELQNMHPKPWSKDALNNFSSIGSIFSANPELHYQFLKNGKLIRAEVKEGEAIYIPAGWWHEMEYCSITRFSGCFESEGLKPKQSVKVFTLTGMTVSANMWFVGDSRANFRPTLMHLKSGSYYSFMMHGESKDL